jgi:hypothetical protein
MGMLGGHISRVMTLLSPKNINRSLVGEWDKFRVVYSFFLRITN